MGSLSPALAWLLTPRWPAVAFALRTTATSLVALAIAFMLGMDDPRWAATTVWIVATPERGMSLSKARFRSLGTLIGACVALTLADTCMQSPELFLGLLALWIGLCTAVATLLRNFRAYGAVLAGYTAAIIAIGAVSQPENVFDIAISRLLYVLLGILCQTLTTSLLAPGSAGQALRAKIRRALSGVAAASEQALRGKLQPGAQMASLVTEINALDTAAEYAAAASSDIDRHLGHIRQIIASLLIQLSGAHSTSRRIARQPFHALTHQPVADLQAGAARLMREVQTLLGERRDRQALEAVAAFRHSLNAGQPLPREGQNAVATENRFLLDRLEVMLHSLETSLLHLVELDGKRILTPRGRTVHHRDVHAACSNGVRAALATGIAAAFWLISAWPQGGTLVIIVAVVCSLFGTRDDSAAGSLAFLQGTAIAVVPAALCTFFLLPAMSGYAMLALAIAPFLFIAGLGYFSPYAVMAAAGSIFFWDMVAPDNLTRQTADGFFNAAIALLLSMTLACLCFNLIMPPNPAKRQRRLLQAIVDDLAEPLLDPDHSTRNWARRLADRIARAGPTLTGNGPERDRVFANLLAALDLGLAGARLARISNEEDLPEAARKRLNKALAVLRHMPERPGAAAVAAASMAVSLRRSLPGLAPRQAIAGARALEAAQELAQRLRDHTDLFVTAQRGQRFFRS